MKPHRMVPLPNPRFSGLFCNRCHRGYFHQPHDYSLPNMHLVRNFSPLYSQFWMTFLVLK